MMLLRKLEKSEHWKTRRLWEQIFVEDTQQFLDYYYSIKTEENEIYVIEEDGEIRSMIHLNPYKMRMGEQLYNTHYIVAVATEEAYRGRGYMSMLLKKVTEKMKEQGEPFTFLMPVAEAIYYPHGFRYIYRQTWRKISGKKSENESIQIAKAQIKDCRDLAEFANAILKSSYNIYVERDPHYYERLLAEVNSEDGAIILAKEKEELVGFFVWNDIVQPEIMEPLFLPGKDEVFYHAISVMTGDETTEVTCLGTEGAVESKPKIMAKILDPSPVLKEVFLEQIPEGISMEDFTSLVFGYLDEEELHLSEELKAKVHAIPRLSRIFLNEIV